jgi:hypothetical protein
VALAQKSMHPYKDANSEVDYGNIDEFYFVDGHYYLAGDWGAFNIVSSKPVFEMAVCLPHQCVEQLVNRDHYE